MQRNRKKWVEVLVEETTWEEEEEGAVEVVEEDIEVEAEEVMEVVGLTLVAVIMRVVVVGAAAMILQKPLQFLETRLDWSWEKVVRPYLQYAETVELTARWTRMHQREPEKRILS